MTCAITLRAHDTTAYAQFGIQASQLRVVQRRGNTINQPQFAATDKSLRLHTKMIDIEWRANVGSIKCIWICLQMLVGSDRIDLQGRYTSIVHMAT